MTKVSVWKVELAHLYLRRFKCKSFHSSISFQCKLGALQHRSLFAFTAFLVGFFLITRQTLSEATGQNPFELLLPVKVAAKSPQPLLEGLHP